MKWINSYALQPFFILNLLYNIGSFKLGAGLCLARKDITEFGDKAVAEALEPLKKLENES